MDEVWRAVDLFSGCGGMTAGLRRAGLHVASAVEADSLAAETYRVNHPDVTLLEQDIRDVRTKDLLVPGAGDIHVVAGCPPCQGFSRVRRKNRSRSAADKRNTLIDEFQRVVAEILPAAVFLENVPGIEKYHRFRAFLRALTELGYEVNWKTVDLYDYGVPQKRKRVVVLAGLGFSIDFPREARVKRTVRSAIGDLCLPERSRNRLHREVTQHSPEMLKRIKAVPKNGGSRSDWPPAFENPYELRTSFRKNGRYADQPRVSCTTGVPCPSKSVRRTTGNLGRKSN